MNVVKDCCSAGTAPQANDSQLFDALMVSQVIEDVSKWPAREVRQ